MHNPDPDPGESGGTGTVPCAVTWSISSSAELADTYVCDACPGCPDLCAFKLCPICAPQRSKPVPAGYYTMCQVRRHNRKEDCWLVAHRRVYDATNFLSLHPAGPRPILSRAGGDCTLDYDFHSSVSQREYWKPLCIGRVVPCPRCDGSSQCSIQ